MFCCYDNPKITIPVPSTSELIKNHSAIFTSSHVNLEGQRGQQGQQGQQVDRRPSERPTERQETYKKLKLPWYSIIF
jgi:hypothetical protein